MYDEYGQIKEKYGRKLARIPLATVQMECRTCPKIPDDVHKTRFQAVDFDERAWAAYQAYRRFKATGHFPDDEMVERVAVIVSEIEQEAEIIRQAMNQRSLTDHMLAVAKLGMMKNG